MAENVGEPMSRVRAIRMESEQYRQNSLLKLPQGELASGLVSPGTITHHLNWILLLIKPFPVNLALPRTKRNETEFSAVGFTFPL